MKLFNILLVLVLFSSLAFSQHSESFLMEDDLGKSVVEEKKDTTKKKVFTNIAIGSSVMASGNNNYALNTYVNPTISYQLTEKFSISMGLMAVQSNFNNFTYYNYEGRVESVNYSGMSAYYTLQGAYQLSEKLRVYGGIMVGTESMDFVGANIPTEQKNNHTPKAYQFGVQYKIGDNAYLQFEFQLREATPMQSMQMQSANGFGMMGNSNMFGPRIW